MTFRILPIAALLAGHGLATPVFAQQVAAQTTPDAPVATADPADVGSIDAIIAALYDVISGDAGVKRDWARMQSLFLPGAKLVPTGPAREGAGFRATLLSPADYVAQGGPLVERVGFHEREIARRTDRFGNIAHVFSTYEGWSTAKDQPEMRIRGINSIQLFHDGSRWWILSIFWQQESPETPIPRSYLPAD